MATLTAQRVVTSLVTATLLLGEARETAQRQLSAEKAKKGSKVRGGTPGLCHFSQHKCPLVWHMPCVADVSPSDLDVRDCCSLLQLTCPDAAAVACLQVSVVAEAQHVPTRVSLTPQARIYQTNALYPKSHLF